MSGTSAVAIDNKIEQAMVSVLCWGDGVGYLLNKDNEI